jgi:hypothetical protein
VNFASAIVQTVPVMLASPVEPPSLDPELDELPLDEDDEPELDPVPLDEDDVPDDPPEEFAPLEDVCTPEDPEVIDDELEPLLLVAPESSSDTPLRVDELEQAAATSRPRPAAEKRDVMGAPFVDRT